MNYARYYKNLLNFVKVMPKLLVVPFFFRIRCIYGWHHLLKATEVTAGLAESNGSLPLVDGLVTCVG